MSPAAHELIEELSRFRRTHAPNCWRPSSRASTDPPRRPRKSRLPGPTRSPTSPAPSPQARSSRSRGKKLARRSSDHGTTMRRVVDVLPQAIDEAREARNYYLSKSAAAEEAFRKELEHAVGMIREHPGTWPTYVHGTPAIRPASIPVQPGLPNRRHSSLSSRSLTRSESRVLAIASRVGRD